MLVCLLFSRRCFHLKESPVFKRVPEASNRPGVVAKTVAQKSFRFGDWKWVELIAKFSRPTFLRPLFAPRPLLLGHNCETSRATVSTRQALASWTISPKEVLEPLLPQMTALSGLPAWRSSPSPTVDGRRSRASGQALLL